MGCAVMPSVLNGIVTQETKKPNVLKDTGGSCHNATSTQCARSQTIPNMENTIATGKISTVEIDGMTWGRGGKNVQNRKMVCNLKCDKGYKAKKKTASCVDGNWLNKPSTCVVKPFNPPESECELPKKANKNNEGTWSCKTVMLDPNERSVEQDLALYQEDGYEVITDESTIAGLTEKGNFMEEYE